MKQIVLLLSLIFPALSLMAQSDSAQLEEPVLFANEMPELPGGQNAMVRFISKNLRYPAEARKAGISGRVFVEFVVEKDGSVIYAKAYKSPNELLSEEAVRVIKLLPKFNPGYINGRLVRVKLIVPIEFALK
jgi:TonB family protein